MIAPPPSLWWSSLPKPVVARPALRSDLDVDVAIVGGGFTGLWTARELLRRDSHLRVAVLEQNVCGFGASGRNGGWASALFPVDFRTVSARSSRDTATELRHTLRNAVRELGEAAAADGIDAHFVQGGSLDFARSDVQAARLRSFVEAERRDGVAERDLQWLEPDEARARGALTKVYGATFTPHCARLHPARLVRGLSDVVEELGVQIFENTSVTRIVRRRARQPAAAITANGVVRAPMVVRATEGFTAALAGQRRTWVPLYSLMVATEVQPTSFWDEVGLAQYETFADDRHLIIYGQRTADDRIAFGGRGAPYHFGSAVEPKFDHSPRVFRLLEDTLRELFPSLSGSVTHRWGGPLAMPRDRMPSVAVDAAAGLASAGGYTGDGVVLSYVAAQALADLIVAPEGRSRFASLPFVNRAPRRWETEPWRWVGINAGLALAARADSSEARHGREGGASKLLERVMNSGTPPNTG